MENAKATYRLESKKRIQILDDKRKIKESKQLCEMLIHILGETDMKTLVTYIPLPDEVDIRDVSKWAHENDKNVIVVGNSPNPEEITLEETGISYCLVPGRAFTQDGKRIGRGGGWFDKFLVKNPHMKSIGVCFGCQIFPDIPQESHDIGVDQVVFSGEIVE